MRRWNANLEQSGFILPVLLFTGLIIVFLIATVSSETLTSHRVATHDSYAVNAQMTADAGLDDAMNKINTVANWTGSVSETTLLDDSVRNIKTTYFVSVSNGADSDHKTLSVTAKTYSPRTATNPVVTRKYVMDIQAVTSGTGPTSVASGVGGLVMSANSKISGGDVVVDGKITMSNNAQIGLSTNPVNVRVADKVCPSPPDSTYPQVCGTGAAQPITMGTNAKIYGNVQATNQTTGTNMFNPGLVTGSPSPVGLPSFDRTSFKSTVSASGQALTGLAAGTCSGGSVNWPANVKITGNISLPNNCTAKINGNVWITGSLTMGNNSILAIQSGVGTTVPDIIIDGSSGINFGNNGKILPNVSGTGAEVITFWSSGSCSPDCSTVTGTDLASSQAATTITLSNNGSAPGSILYSYWSEVSVTNNGNIGALAGQTIALGNNAVINFTSSVPGSDNRITTWVKRGYMRVYN